MLQNWVLIWIIVCVVNINYISIILKIQWILLVIKLILISGML